MGTKLWDRIAARMGLRASVEAVPARLVVSGPVESLQAEPEPTAEDIEREYGYAVDDAHRNYERRCHNYAQQLEDLERAKHEDQEDFHRHLADLALWRWKQLRALEKGADG